nr:hypothetical protein CKG001_17640 [Bdellovibrio sp. CKG001]
MGPHMKMYANYILERLGRDLILYPDLGFATFQITEKECYLVDIYVEKPYRKQDVATRLADDVVKIAKEKGCTILKGSVDLRAKNPDTSMRALLSYGLKPYSAEDSFIIFYKDI